MHRTVCTCLALFFGISTSAHAQFAVIDPANLAQAVLIAERTWQQYDQLRQQFERIQKMAQGIGDMDRFRTPALALAEHDPAKLQYGGPWLGGLSSGDPSGAAYRAT